MALDEGKTRRIPSAAELPGLYRQSLSGSSEQVSIAVDQIATMIIQGRLAPGQRVIEPDISEALGIARGRVREALRILAGNGMIELVPNRGARVRALGRADLASTMQALAAVVLMGVEIFGKVHGKPVAAVADAIRGANGRMRDAAEARDIFALPARQTEYHVLINDLSGNSHLNFLVSKLNIPFYEIALSRAHTADSMRRSTIDYDRATDLILAGKAGEASALLKQLSFWFIDSLVS